MKKNLETDGILHIDPLSSARWPSVSAALQPCSVFPCLLSHPSIPTLVTPEHQRKTSVERGVKAVLLPVTLIPWSPLETCRGGDLGTSLMDRETGLFPPAVIIPYSTLHKQISEKDHN